MIGKTNAVVGGGAPTEKVNVTLTSNQSSSGDLLGATITLSYGSYSEDFVWDGRTLTFSVMQYITYTLSFSNVSGYKTPAPVEFTAVADNVRQVNAQYQTEVITVTVSADSGASVSGQKVTINGVTTTLRWTSAVTQKVPYGTSYSVSVNDKSGYNTPATQTFTASQPARSVSMVYEEIRFGVYIQDTVGKLWKASAWDGSAAPNGVAVLTESCSFVIALSENTRITIKDSANGYSSSMNLTVYSSSSDAIKNYSGASNTNVMVSAYGSTSNQAEGYCANFTFPNGKKGYLGSAGEWQAFLDNQSDVEACMSKVGGADFNGVYYWSSTRGLDGEDEDGYYCNSFWVMDQNYGTFFTQYANIYFILSYSNTLHARPFTTL